MELSLSQYHHSAIYKITNKVNGKIYIGQAQDFYLRYYEHKKIKGNGYLQRAFKKYGFENFEFDIVEQPEIKNLNEREQYWMDYYKSYDKKIGYNICKEAGTTRGRKRNPNELDGIRKYRKGRIGEKNAFYGRHHSEETKIKISNANKGRKRNNEQIKKLIAVRKINNAGKPTKSVFQINKTTNDIIKKWDCISEAGRYLKIKQSEIVLVANQTPIKKNDKIYTKKSAGGFHWKYAN